MKDTVYLDAFIDAREFLEGLSVLLWSLDSFLRGEGQEDVAKSLFFFWLVVVGI